jgi:hypothetical protein
MKKREPRAVKPKKENIEPLPYAGKKRGRKVVVEAGVIMSFRCSLKVRDKLRAMGAGRRSEFIRDAIDTAIAKLDK